MTPQEQAAAYLEKRWHGRGPCLIAKPSATFALNSHENDFCECEMSESFVAGYHAGAAHERARAERDELLDSIQHGSEENAKWIAKLHQKLATAKAALEGIAENAGHAALCETKLELSYCEAGCEYARTARKALGEIGADSPSHMGFFGGEGVEK